MNCTTPSCRGTAVDQFIGLCVGCSVAPVWDGQCAFDFCTTAVENEGDYCADCLEAGVGPKPVDTRPYVRTVFIDYETFKFGPYNMAPKPIVLAWATDGHYGREKVGMVAGLDAMKRHIADLLTRANNGDFVLSGFNVAYDMACTIATFPDLIPLTFETYANGQIADIACLEHLLDIAEGSHGVHGRKYNLAEVVERRLGVVMEGKAVKNNGEVVDEAIQMSFEQWEGRPLAEWTRETKDYVYRDVKLGLRLFRNQEDRLREIQYSAPDLAAQSRASLCLYLTTAWGMTAHRPTVEALDNKIVARQAELVPILEEYGLVNIKAKGKYAGKVSKSNKMMQEIVYEAFKGDPPRTPKGGVAIDGDVLEDADLLLGGKNPGFTAWSEYSGLQKTRGTYVLNFYAPISHINFNTLVNTGRTSAFGTAAGGFNSQNFPRLPGVRECFRPRRADHCLSSVDFDSQEMRTWAEACVVLTGRSVLARKYSEQADYDPHLAMAAAQLLHISEEDALALKNAKDEKVLEARQAAKIPNFSLPGMVGVGGLIRFARGYDQRWLDPNCRGCDDLDSFKHGHYIGHTCFANDMREAWQRQWPENRDYFGFIKSLDGTITQLYSGRRRGDVQGPAAANTLFQGLAADATKSAFFEVVRRCYDWTMASPLFGCRPVNMVHDDVTLEMPDANADVAAEEQRRVMVDAAQEWTPNVPARASATLMKVWSKKAYPVYDGERMVPWEPEGYVA